MPYWQLYYHIVWSTKYREHLITPDSKPVVYELLQSKAVELGATLFALNGMADHIHMIVSIPPKIAVATFVGQVKGATATRFNKSGNRLRCLFWQREYAAFSFDRKRLAPHVAYVENQKQHHMQETLIRPLEPVCDEGTEQPDGDSLLPGDSSPGYVRELSVWYGSKPDQYL